jgi:hypothetical protein
MIKRMVQNLLKPLKIKPEKKTKKTQIKTEKNKKNPTQTGGFGVVAPAGRVNAAAKANGGVWGLKDKKDKDGKKKSWFKKALGI